ncbi:hypothetical protein lerEdw1_009811 [Lerista edwardsae]|nr:hypothetical protein lerEdw1_009811 [Lerista edwardsae]
MRLQKGYKVQRNSFAPQTVRKLLEQKRQQQSVQDHEAGPQVPAVALEATQPAETPFPELPGAPEGGGPTPGRTAAPEYPVAGFPAWPPGTLSQAAFPDYRYHCVDATKNYLLHQPPGNQYDMSFYTPLEGSVYGPPGPGATEDAYSSKMVPVVDYEKAATDTQASLYPEGTWLRQEQDNLCLLPAENYQATPVEVDPDQLAQARTEIQNMDLARLLQQDEDGDMLLHLLVAQGLRPLAYAAAEMLRDCGQLDAKEHKGKTPLLVAAAANQPEIVKDLIMLGADVNAVDQKGQTVLHLGATYGLPDVITAVMVTGVPVNVEARNFEGLTPLHCAIISHNAAFQTQSTVPAPLPHLQEVLRCVELLLHLGADYKSPDLKSSKTVLHLAVQAANLPLIQFLLQLPRRELHHFVNLKAHGNTALHMAAGLHGHPFQEQIVCLLLNHWADPSARNLENEQPVHLLAPGPAAEQLRVLLRSRRTGPGPAHLPPLP